MNVWGKTSKKGSGGLDVLPVSLKQYCSQILCNHVIFLLIKFGHRQLILGVGSALRVAVFWHWKLNVAQPREFAECSKKRWSALADSGFPRNLNSWSWLQGLRPRIIMPTWLSVMLHSSNVSTLSVWAAWLSSWKKVEGYRWTRLCPLRSSTSKWAVCLQSAKKDMSS